MTSLRVSMPSVVCYRGFCFTAVISVITHQGSYHKYFHCMLYLRDRQERLRDVYSFTYALTTGNTTNIKKNLHCIVASQDLNQSLETRNNSEEHSFTATKWILYFGNTHCCCKYVRKRRIRVEIIRTLQAPLEEYMLNLQCYFLYTEYSIFDIFFFNLIQNSFIYVVTRNRIPIPINADLIP